MLSHTNLPLTSGDPSKNYQDLRVAGLDEDDDSATKYTGDDDRADAAVLCVRRELVSGNEVATDDVLGPV